MSKYLEYTKCIPGSRFLSAEEKSPSYRFHKYLKANIIPGVKITCKKDLDYCLWQHFNCIITEFYSQLWFI